MYILKTKSKFDGAHFLKDYEGKCANIHGHRWTVEVSVRGEDVRDEGAYRGMVVDFHKLKADLKEETDRFDHTLIYEAGSLREKTLEAMREEGFVMNEVPFRPTAECLARYFYGQMSEKGYVVDKVTVYETPDNAATYCVD